MAYGVRVYVDGLLGGGVDGSGDALIRPARARIKPVAHHELLHLVLLVLYWLLTVHENGEGRVDRPLLELQKLRFLLLHVVLRWGCRVGLSGPGVGSGIEGVCERHGGGRAPLFVNDVALPGLNNRYRRNVDSRSDHWCRLVNNWSLSSSSLVVHSAIDGVHDLVLCAFGCSCP